MSTPIDDIDDQLRDAMLRSRRRTKLVRDAKAIEGHLAEHRARVAQLRTAHNDELADVAALTSASVRKLVARIRGDLEERLSIEEAQAAQAATALANAQDLFGVEEDRLAVVRQELDELGRPETDIESLRLQKLDHLEPDSELGRELADIAERRTLILADLREVDEAIAAGERCLSSLGHAAEMLRSAGNWSTWDVFGGGALVTMQKHSRLSDARQAGSAAAAALTRFADELADVQEDVATAPSVTLTSWDHTFDFWFDNIFTDMRIDGMIRRSQADTARVDGDVRELVQELRRMHAALTANATDLDLRQQHLLDPPTP